MKVLQKVLRESPVTAHDIAELAAMQPQLVLAFGSVSMLQAAHGVLAQVFDRAHVLGCSTAGEITPDGVEDDSLVLTALHMDKIQVNAVSTLLQGMDDSHSAGKRLAQALPAEGLRAVIVLGQGVQINGSALVAGMSDVLGNAIPITGGLAGDGGAFAQTWVLDDQGLSSERVACIGLYGEGLIFSHGSFGGWSAFGPARKVTRCANNVLYELDGEPALAVYKRYLGEHASGLPASGLLFPFSMLGSDHGEAGLIRTILAVDEAAGSLTLAGEIDPNGYLKLMHANTDALVNGAEAAAEAAKAMHEGSADSVVLLVSCVGRKLVMGGRVDEEVEAVADVFGQNAALTGFYSYGEISPFTPGVACKLHNQTMTITRISESA